MELAIRPAVFLKAPCATITELAKPRPVSAILATVLETKDATRRSATLRLMMFAMAMENVWTQATGATRVAVTKAILMTTSSVSQRLAILRRVSALATGRASNQPMEVHRTVSVIPQTLGRSAQNAHLKPFLLMGRVFTNLA